MMRGLSHTNLRKQRRFIFMPPAMGNIKLTLYVSFASRRGKMSAIVLLVKSASPPFTLPQYAPRRVNEKRRNTIMKVAVAENEDA